MMIVGSNDYSMHSSNVVVERTHVWYMRILVFVLSLLIFHALSTSLVNTAVALPIFLVISSKDRVEVTVDPK